jgi:hypothetical protein
LKEMVGSSERLLGGDLCISTQVVTVSHASNVSKS